MGSIGFTELLIILIIILIIFGPGKLPEIGEALGKAVGNFKRAVKKGENEPDENEKKVVASYTAKDEKKTDTDIKG